MDRLFQRPIICTYLAWREAKHRGSWFFFFVGCVLFAVFLSTQGCVDWQEAEYRQSREAVERGAAIRALYDTPLPPVVLQPGERMETDMEALSRGAWPGSYRIIRAPAPNPYDACSIYGMDQSVWEALQPHPGREQTPLRSVYHGYNDRHLPQARGTHSAPRATSPIITPHATQAEQPDVQRGMNWEDQYDYGGDGQNDGGGTGGFLP
jgi:hypothetical protein